MLRNKLFLSLFTATVVLFCAASAQAALELTLTQGVDKAINLTLQSQPMSGNSASVAGQLISVVRNDLQNSGRFNVSSATASNAVLNYFTWRAEKVDNVVRYKVQPVAGGKYKVSFALYGIYSKSLLLNKNYTVSSGALRKLSHHISDLIYAKLIGIPGIFSTRIAYILVKRYPHGRAKYYLQVSDADGYNPHSLMTSSQPIMSPAWSPNYKNIAYVSFEGHRAAIYVQNVATGARRLISKFPGINGAPAWSPDGKNMALVLTKTGMPKIYLMNLATHKLRRLTSGYSIDTEPGFAPNGKSLIFTSNRGGRPQIYKLNLTNGSISRVTYSGPYNARASYSSDGKSIVMLHQEGGMFNIALQDLASGRVINLSKIGNEESPSFAPNGAMVVYATNVNGRGILAEVSTDAKVMLKLPSEEGAVQEPAWGK